MCINEYVTMYLYQYTCNSLNIFGFFSFNAITESSHLTLFWLTSPCQFLAKHNHLRTISVYGKLIHLSLHSISELEQVLYYKCTDNLKFCLYYIIWPISCIMLAYLSIAQWLMVSSKQHGCANSSRSFVLLFTVQLWCIVTTSAPSTCPPTRFSINARSTLRLTSTSSVSMLPLVISACYMFQHHHNTPTSSPKGCLLYYLRSSGPV
jgi:hypothetical protein